MKTRITFKEGKFPNIYDVLSDYLEGPSFAFNKESLEVLNFVGATLTSQILCVAGLGQRC